MPAGEAEEVEGAGETETETRIITDGETRGGGNGGVDLDSAA